VKAYLTRRKNPNHSQTCPTVTDAPVFVNSDDGRFERCHLHRQNMYLMSANMGSCIGV
jgi:hypothetical protein